MEQENKDKSKAKYTNDDLKRLQALPLWRKVQITKSRILEFNGEFQGKTHIWLLLFFIFDDQYASK